MTVALAASALHMPIHFSYFFHTWKNPEINAFWPTAVDGILDFDNGSINLRTHRFLRIPAEYIN